MKKLDLGQTITILANVGVIAGIVFLAIELRQNNRLLVAEAEFNQLQHLQDIGMVLFENPEVADMYTRALDGDELDRVEQRRMLSFHLIRFRDWEWQFRQNRAGALEDMVALETAIVLRFNSPELIGATPDVFDQVWRISRREADPDFVKFFEGITGVSE